MSWLVQESRQVSVDGHSRCGMVTVNNWIARPRTYAMLEVDLQDQ